MVVSKVEGASPWPSSTTGVVGVFVIDDSSICCRDDWSLLFVIGVVVVAAIASSFLPSPFFKSSDANTVLKQKKHNFISCMLQLSKSNQSILSPQNFFLTISKFDNLRHLTKSHVD